MSSLKLIKGSYLKILLKRKKISQKELCDEFGFNRTTVSRYFSDDMAMPANFIIKVAAYSGLSISDLTEGNDIKSEKSTNSETQISSQEKYISASTLHHVAEPHEVYDLPAASPPAPAERPMISIDMSVLEDKLRELYRMMHDVQDEIKHIKDEIHLVNH